MSPLRTLRLGKTGWKLHTEEHSLVSRLFKAWYFSSSNYFNAKLGHNLSYIWRSILRAQFIVQGGTRWCIGPCNSIPILNEPWLKNDRCIACYSPETNFLHNFTVASFIDTDAKQWNSNLIQQLFSKDQAANILHTPLVPHIPADVNLKSGEKWYLFREKWV